MSLCASSNVIFPGPFPPFLPRSRSVRPATYQICRRLCRALPFFTVGDGLGGFLRGATRVFERGQEERTVVTAHAVVASRKLEQEEHARTIQPRLRLRAVDFKTAAIRAAAVQPNSTHDNNTAEKLLETPRCFKRRESTGGSGSSS